MKKIRLNIQSESDRVKMIIALANSGYTVTTKIEKDSNRNTIYWIIFELPDLNIKES